MFSKYALIVACLFLVSAAFGQNPSPEGLVAYWNFDEDGGKILHDVSGHGHTGKLLGDVERVLGLQGRALAFPGELDAYAEMTKTDLLDTAEAVTIEAWVRRTDTGTLWDCIVANGDSNAGYQLFFSERDQSMVFYTNTDQGGYGPTNGAFIPMDAWMHLAATFDATAGKVVLYQNGKRTGERAVSGQLSDFPVIFRIGRGVHFSAFRGLVDEVKVWNRVLSAQEVAAAYEAHAAELPPPASVPTPVFTNLQATLEGPHTRLTFEKISEEDGNAQVVIIRNHHRRLDTNPGALSGVKVFEGTLTRADGRGYTFVDRMPREDGHTYYYWVTPDEKNFRVKPAKVRDYHSEIWWTPEKIDAKIDQLARAYPDKVNVKTIGHSVEGRPFRALYIGNPDRRIMLLGAVHVSESGPELILGATERLLQDRPELLDQVGLAVLPCSSLDQRAHLLSTGYPQYLRKNANGVDINRNFDGKWTIVEGSGTTATDNPDSETYRGPAPMSEPEAKVIAQLVEEAQPMTLLSFHSVGSIANAKFLGTAYADDEFSERCHAITDVYARGMYPENWQEYADLEMNLPQGRLASWLYLKHGIPGFDLELDKNPEPRKVVYGDAVSVEMMREFQQRHADGIAALIEALIRGDIQ